MAKDKAQWADFITKHELELHEPDSRGAKNSAVNIGLSYAAGGLVPLSPYFFTLHPKDGLLYSCCLTIFCLLVFGFLKARATGRRPVGGAVRVTLIGLAAAAAAFGIVRFFS